MGSRAYRSAFLKIISTRGDRLVDLPQSNLEKGFTKELEVALLAGDVDLAVHSLKDLPVVPPQGLALSARRSGRLSPIC